MNRNPNRQIGANKYSRSDHNYRRPFWLPASNYYILTVAVSTAFFFLVFGVFHEENEDITLVIAGIGASSILGGAVFLREVILRKARINFLIAQKRLDANINQVTARASTIANPNKLTLEQNSTILKEISRKSEAAKVLGNLSDGHFEVFEMCNEYLNLSENELKTVGVGSPRLAALRRGREKTAKLHHYHLLQWAEIETRTLTRESKNALSIAEKLDSSQKALHILDSALQYYPTELHLNESRAALIEFIASIKVSHWIEQAERSVFKGNYKRALSHYRDALFYLGRENVQNEQRQLIADKINEEMEKIRTLNDGNKNKRIPSKKIIQPKEKYD